ncbi:hypothetical protein H4Q26_012350 [Puccinia striiformis f. sp. tritici PST-130]|nr:hypothetical protein H4Q26_012350 [Puccinia striiformis f. sp. tritici PST-130]
MNQSRYVQILAALADLSLSGSLINRLAILSPNETLDDIKHNDLNVLPLTPLRITGHSTQDTGGVNAENLEQAKVNNQ